MAYKSGTLYFCIASRNEKLVYETNCLNYEFDKYDERMNLQQVTAHSVIDLIMEKSLKTNQMFLGHVDQLNGCIVFAFMTPSGHMMILLTNQFQEDVVKALFTEVFDAFIKVTLNPFYQYDTPITNREFDTRVKNCLRRFSQR